MPKILQKVRPVRLIGVTERSGVDILNINYC